MSERIILMRSRLEATGLGQAELMGVITGMAMNPVMVWMVLLLDGGDLEKRGDFYKGMVFVEENYRLSLS